MKPIIMLLGSSHLANPGVDSVNPKIDDVLAPKRQREIERLVTGWSRSSRGFNLLRSPLK